jgi:hypothetical protein
MYFFLKKHKYVLIFWKERPMPWTALSIKLVSNPFMFYDDEVVKNVKFLYGKMEEADLDSPATRWVAALGS